jgi:hypothetical protein
MKTISINFIMPESWADLSDKRLRYVYQLLANDFDTDEVKTLCLLYWSGTKVIGKQPDGAYLLKKGDVTFEVTASMIAELISKLDWLSSVPSQPIRISVINRHHAIAADFQGVPFETYIIVDNLYQGYLATKSDSLLDDIAVQLYGAKISLKPYEKISIFYWMASLKAFLANRYPDFFQVTSDENLLGTSATQIEEAMNAQIRALTKGDVTKEAEILALDTWRALTELNAQAREYKELKTATDGK